ncbi:Nuclear envelope morphology protein 1 [Taxawa tesnikishii (nom. ined.)]|nr:Nuclear envelope morphology protein 1 [Dothideales sp. JES 119]
MPSPAFSKLHCSPAERQRFRRRSALHPAAKPSKVQDVIFSQYTQSGRSSRDDGRRSNETFGVVATPEKLANGSGDGFGGAEHDQAIAADEKTPLLQQQKPDSFAEKQSSHWRLPKQIAHTIVSSLKMALSAIAAPARLVVACFYDEQGTFSTLAPIRRLNRAFSKKKRRPIAYTVESSEGVAEKEAHREKPRLRPKGDSSDDLKREESPQRSFSVDSNASTVLPSDSETEKPTSPVPDDGPARHTRSKSASSRAGDEIAPAKKSIRIKLHSQESLLRQKRQVMGNRERPASNGNTDEDKVAAVASSLKSPSSPAVTKLKYPRAPAPPRPLVPRRQNSYTMAANGEVPKKTLIIDLDETLIHSMAKGGRMSTGHMVEVKLQGPVGGNGMFVGPQVPILYYVHERPHCHEFLRKVCKWYNLIVFTASVQEYADPVIDWLERERKYFSGRYYRQHCTFRNGAYIKDLSQVEPDLSKVMILDNSPMSYIFHEDNAIPIEGWISDPTDNDLLHLVPLLEGLQYVTDVRALLALRLGQHE